MIRRHLLMVIVLFIIIAGTGIGLTVYTYQTNPRYEAEARVRIDPATSRDPRMVAGSDIVVPTQLMDQFIQTQVRMITNAEVLDRVFEPTFANLIATPATGLNNNERTIARERRADLDWARNLIEERHRQLLENKSQILGDAGTPAPVLREKLSVSQVLRTNLISIRMQGSNRELITNTVNSVVDSYMLAVKEDRKNRNDRRVDNLLAQSRNLERRAEELQRDIRNFVAENNMLFQLVGNQELVSRMMLVERQWIEAEAELREAELNYRQMQRLAEQQLTEGQILEALSPMMLLQMEGDREMVMLVAQKHDLSRRKESLLEQFGPEYQAIKTINSQIATVDQQLESRRAMLMKMLLDQQRVQTTTAYAQAAETVELLKREYDKARATASDAAAKQAQYESMRQEYETVLESLNEVRAAIRDTQIAAEVSENVISIAEVARVPGPDEQVGSPVLYGTLSVLLAVLFSAGMAMMVELVDNRVRTPQQVARTIQMPMLGIIPDGREDPATRSVSNLSQVAMNAPQSLFAESFRQLRTSLLYSSDSDLKTLLVTSPQAGEGKTMVASNMAVTLANGGSKVLLVDTNFRRPAVHTQFDLQNTTGLSSVLARLSDLDEAVQQTQVANMEVLSCGPLPPSPADLLGSQAMQDLLEKMRERYDAVVLDGPPMLLVADGHVLASMVDGVALVMSTKKTSRGVAMRTKRMLQGLRARLVGGILNRVRAQKGGYFRESFRAYYEYSGRKK